MSDPSIQTLCCHSPVRGNPSISVMTEFNSVPFNVVCLLSSLAGIGGAIYQMLPREETSLSQRWFSLTSLRGRQIIVWLAFADLLASLGLFMRSVVKLHDCFLEDPVEPESVAFCIILAAWTEYFYVVTWAWTLVYAVDTWMALEQKSGKPVLYHLLVWSVPAVLVSIGLLILYYPDADCHNSRTDSDAFFRLLPNYFVTYGPIGTVMVACPIFYLLSTQRIRLLVTNCLGQVTKKERTVVKAVKRRFGLINLAFYICWLPNLVNGIVIWVSWYNLPKSFMITLWYMMAVLNPLQALFNSIVYQRANLKIIVPFKLTRSPNETTPLIQTNINT